MYLSLAVSQTTDRKTLECRQEGYCEETSLEQCSISDGFWFGKRVNPSKIEVAKSTHDGLKSSALKSMLPGVNNLTIEVMTFKLEKSSVPAGGAESNAMLSQDDSISIDEAN